MFCQKCGQKNSDLAKFCSACGNPMSVDTVTNPIETTTNLVEKVFFNENGILVSSALFKTDSASSYPIRNISSVSVARKDANGIVILFAYALSLFGLFLMFGSVGAGAVFIGLSIPFWIAHSNRAYQLKIGSGGVFQTAIESQDEGQLQKIAKSINEAIIFIQA
jgi:uncharacterized membrane protein YvbJ